MALRPEQKQTYEENGFLHIKHLFPVDWMAQIREECDNIHQRMLQDKPNTVGVSWEDDFNPGLIRQLMHSEMISPTLNKILRSDTMLDIIEDLIGPDIALYHSKLLPKTAGQGAAIPWHQDYAYWQNKENLPLMVNCQMAIDAATVENGCLEFIPGSQKWGLQEHEHHQETFGVFLPGRYYQREEATIVPMEPGDGVFFTSLTIHGSSPNTSDKDRWANTFAYNVTGNGATQGQNREILRGKQLSTT
ncbi:MAG: phytanoyl-CoA dioxygenase family protein [Chloroflexota bacterium]